jgi:hypothetical protein
MSDIDFEISASFRARELALHVFQDTVTKREGEEVELDRHESRTGPAEMTAGETYEDVVVEKRVTGRLDV